MRNNHAFRQSEINNLQRKGTLLQKRLREWTEELRHDGRSIGVLRMLYRFGFFLTSGALILFAAAFVLNYLTFSGIGFASLELALATTVSIVLVFEMAFRSFGAWYWGDNGKKLVLFFIASVAGTALLVAQGFLGYIRGSLMEEATFVSPSLLSFLFPLLTISVEIGACIAFHEGIINLWSPARSLWLHHKIAVTEEELIDIANRIDELSAEMEVGATERTLQLDLDPLRHKKVILKRLLFGLVVLAVLLVGIGISVAAAAECDVVLLDLSGSSLLSDRSAKGTELEKNIAAIPHVIHNLNAGSWISIVGITDQSLSRPLVILEGSIPIRKGLFGEKTEFEKKKLIKRYKVAAETLRPDYKASDVFGAIYLASNLYPQWCEEKRLYIYSDMRHIDHRFDLQNVPVVPLHLIQSVEKKGMIPQLEGVKVFVGGAHPIDKDARYWQSLKAFWEAYFQKAKAVLENFSINQEMENEQRY